MATGQRAAGRRAYGTGSLQLVGGSWVGLWRAPDGRRIKRRLGKARTPGERDGLTKVQAEEAFRRLRAEEVALAHRVERVTMLEAGEALSARLAVRGRKKSHRLTVGSDLRNHIVPFFAGKELSRITARDIERYIAVKQRSLATKTVRNHLGTMHSVFELGLRRGWCSSNPVKVADRPVIRRTETRIRFLDQTELAALLAAPYPDDAWGRVEPTLYLTAAMTGLRQGELLGLRWRDVDFPARKLRVVSPYVRGEFGDPKSEGSGRSVPMADRVAAALRALRGASYYSSDRDLVFCHPESGRPLDRSKLVRRFKQALERAGVREITFHELRHTFGTRMAASGTPLRTHQHWLGHADAKTTQIYAHYQPHDQEAELVDRAFGGARPPRGAPNATARGQGA
jgi:integrase